MAVKNMAMSVLTRLKNQAKTDKTWIKETHS